MTNVPEHTPSILHERIPWRPHTEHCSCAGQVDRLTRELEAAQQPIKDAYDCEDCGRRDGMDAVLPPDLWAKISDGKSILCLWCMDRRAEQAGIRASVSLHFAGRALNGTSQSDADQEHIARLAAQLEAARQQIAGEHDRFVEADQERADAERSRDQSQARLDAALAALRQILEDPDAKILDSHREDGWTVFIGLPQQQSREAER